MYKYYNANEHNNFVNDCVIRAISTAEDKSWSETYDDLSRIAKKNGILLDDVNFVERCAIGTYLITMPNHITTVIDGVVYDTFDCRDRVLWDVWKVE